MISENSNLCKKVFDFKLAKHEDINYSVEWF